ncbi:LacI family DNA-binding transcriptional regulator [Shouchella sp. JSM 1781072]|uniref:LacI family DNA-binding transcriptional regulator n=1 Tax=Shouchella sp. JSM 1781072 TaxID=3344581 RepID=UPI0035C18757
MVSIRDIAKKAGVSMTSVSYALNDNPKVSKKTTAHIKQIAAELNYRPNAAARTLKARKTKKLGVFIKENKGIFYGDILAGIIETSAQAGFDTVVCTGDNATDALADGSVDGGIIMDDLITSEEIMRLADGGKKIVVLDRTFYHKHVRQVLLDNQKGATQMIAHLQALQGEKTFIVTGSPNNFDSQERLKAVQAFFIERAPTYPIEILEAEFELDGGLDAAERIYAQWDGKPIRVFALSDSTAVGMQRYFQENGLMIGKDIKLAGFDNSLLSQYITPPLTTVDYTTKEWGNEAAHVLMALIAEEEAHDSLIATTLMIRASTHT